MQNVAETPGRAQQVPWAWGRGHRVSGLGGGGLCRRLLPGDEERKTGWGEQRRPQPTTLSLAKGPAAL